MLDQKQSNNISKGFGCIFLGFGVCMLFIGIPFITIENRNDFENTIMAMCIISGVLMLIGGYQTIKKSKQKDKAIDLYQEQVTEQLRAIQNAVNSQETSIQKTSVDRSSVDKPFVNTPSENKPSIDKPSDVYVPDILAKWNYTKEEWKLMTKEETTRRLKEGIWVTILIGLVGGWVLSSFKGTTFLTGLIISLSVGIVMSLLKVLLSNNLFNPTKNNTIILTTNALIINGKFKTLSDMDIHLEYVKPVKINEDKFIEFSLQWQTRNGATNDQMRIYVPKIYENDIQKVLNYYSAKGVRIED